MGSGRIRRRLAERLVRGLGEVAHALSHPSGGVEREYWIEVAGRVRRSVADQLVAGVELEDGPARAVRARVLR